MQLSEDDQLISVLGGIKIPFYWIIFSKSLLSGIIGFMNCISRFLGGYLSDRFRFCYFQSLISLTISVTFIITMFIYNINFYGFSICLCILYLLGFTHFSSIPAQVVGKHSNCEVLLRIFQAIYLLNSSHNGVLIGALGKVIQIIIIFFIHMDF